MAGLIEIRELLQEAATLKRSGKRDEALSRLEEARAVAVASKNREYLSEVENSYGNYHGRFSEFTTELRHRKRAIALLGPEGHPVKLAISRANLGGCYLYLGEFAKAVSELHKSLNHYTGGMPYRTLLQYAKPEELPYLLHTIYTLANVYHSLQDYSTSLCYLELSTELEKKHELEMVADSAGLIASCYLESGDLERAGEYAKLQLKLSKDQGSVASEAMALSAFAVIAFRRGDYQLSREHTLRALEAAIVADDPLRLTELYCNLADIEHTEGSYESAIELLNKARVELDRLKTPMLHERIHRTLSAVYEAQQCYERALQEYKLAVEYKEKVCGLIHQQEVARIRDTYQRKCVLRERNVLAKRVRELAEVQPMPTVRPVSTHILQIAPNLTKTEVKICELLHRGSTTKEIARETNSSRHTVDGHRTSIRKKLKLTASEDLVTYLMKLELD